jgi:hypothetical protein
MSKAKVSENVEYILCLAENDPHLKEYGDVFKQSRAIIWVAPENGLIKQVNYAAQKASGNLFVNVSDDFSCPYNWDEILLEATKFRKCFTVKVCDGIQPFVMTLPIMDREFYNMIGGYVFYHEYKHMYADEELASVSKILNTTINVDAVFPHNHYSTGKSRKDDVNEENDSFYGVDLETFTRRKSMNFGLS